MYGTDPLPIIHLVLSEHRYCEYQPGRILVDCYIPAEKVPGDFPPTEFQEIRLDFKATNSLDNLCEVNPSGLR